MIPAEERRAASALRIAGGLGLGRLPVAPGTWGSLGSVGLYLLLEQAIPSFGRCFGNGAPWRHDSPEFLLTFVTVNAVIAAAGVWAAGRVAHELKHSDPGVVVIDEISGQQLVFIGLAPVSWLEVVAGFLLFRALDIWKPFPARRAEALPGGWGIMADDWIAGIYTVLGLWILRLAGGWG